MTLIDKYNELLELSKKLVWYENVKVHRGYLTYDEKNEYRKIKLKLEKLEKLPKQLSF